MKKATPEEFELIDVVRRQLTAAGIRFDTGKTIGGVQPDFVVRSPDGRLFVLEVKQWPAHGMDLKRAVHQAKLYQRTTGADKAFIVVPETPDAIPGRGVVTIDNLIDTLKAEISRRRRAEPRKLRVPPRKVTKTIFVAMPFDSRYDDAFFVAITHAAKAVGAKARRVDREEFVGDIIGKILSLIEESIAVIVDLSEARPNVLYEAGYAHALGKPTVHICSTQIKELPFDVSHWNTISYSVGQTHVLKPSLAKRLKGVIKTKAAA